MYSVLLQLCSNVSRTYNLRQNYIDITGQQNSTKKNPNTFKLKVTIQEGDVSSSKFWNPQRFRNLFIVQTKEIVVKDSIHEQSIVIQQPKLFSSLQSI